MIEIKVRMLYQLLKRNTHFINECIILLLNSWAIFPLFLPLYIEGKHDSFAYTAVLTWTVLKICAYHSAGIVIVVVISGRHNGWSSTTMEMNHFKMAEKPWIMINSAIVYGRLFRTWILVLAWSTKAIKWTDIFQ